MTTVAGRDVALVLHDGCPLLVSTLAFDSSQKTHARTLEVLVREVGVEYVGASDAHHRAARDHLLGWLGKKHSIREAQRQEYELNLHRRGIS